MAAPPVIDGNLDDIIAFGTANPSFCSTNVENTNKPQCNSPGFEPCPTPNPGVSFYFVNGFDLTRTVTVYDRVNRKLYLGIRVAGFIGDTDGDGNPDAACSPLSGVCANPSCGGITDGTGINLVDGDFYQWGFNLNCAGGQDGLVRILGDDPVHNATDRFMFGLGASAHIAAMAYRVGGLASGHDIEVEVDDVDLVPPYQIEGKVGSSAECLGEDAGPIGTCAPTPSITISKAVDVSQLCPGQVATFTVVVTNTGGFDFRDHTIAGVSFPGHVDLSDPIPPGLTYVSGSATNTCGAAAPTLIGNTLSWAFPLDAGASCTFTFQAQALPDCFGAETNTATATGHFSHPCLGGGVDQPVGPVSASATVLCVQPPAVTIVCSTDVGSQCPGKPVVVTATATNTSLSPEDVSITIEGTSFSCGTLAAGATCTQTRTINMPACTAGGTVTFHTSAAATNSCSPPASNTSDCPVTCLPPPSANLTLLCEPAKACPGQPVTLTATASNNGTASETIKLTVEGQTFDCGTVAVGGTCTETKIVNMPACADGDLVKFHASAVATTSCGDADAPPQECSVECLGAQINITKTASRADTVSEGEVLTYTMVVTNTSSDTPLSDVLVTDTFQEAYAGNASPPASTEPAIGTVGGTVTWSLGTLAPGATTTLTFDVRIQTFATCQARPVVNSVTVAGNCFDSRATQTASKTNHVVCPTPGRCWLTGGGQSFDADGHLHSYGGVVNPGCSPTAAGGGNWNDLDHTTGAHFKGTTIVVDLCGNVPGIPPGSSSPTTPFNFIEFHGTGYITGLTGKGNSNKRVDVCFNGHYEDRHEPGSLGEPDTTKKDRYFLRVYTDCTDPLASTVMLVDIDGNPGTQDPTAIFHGNLQLHISGCDKFAAMTSGDPQISQPVDDGLALPTEISFGLPRPNPTNTSMEIRYSLPEEGAVSVRVFDVAGRVVLNLGDTVVGPGWHQVSWNLQNQSGAHVGPGLYFLKMSVNGQTYIRHVAVMR